VINSAALFAKKKLSNKHNLNNSNDLSSNNNNSKDNNKIDNNNKDPEIHLAAEATSWINSLEQTHHFNKLWAS